MKNPLRPFTRDDWQAYQGCETEAPEIGESDNGLTQIVLDGLDVGAQVMNESTEADGGEVFCRTFPNEATARLVAETLLQDPSRVEALLGTAVGSF